MGAVGRPFVAIDQRRVGRAPKCSRNTHETKRPVSVTCGDKGAGAPVTFGALMAFVRVSFPSDPARNGSVVKQLLKKWGPRDVEAMVKGAALLGWKDLRAINAADGVGRRWSQAAYWSHENTAARPRERLEGIAQVLKARGLV